MNLNPILKKKVIQKKMKTSKIIFVTLIISIAVFIIAAFIDIRINGISRGKNSADLKSQKQMTEPFKVISAINSRNIRIVQSDSSYIELAWTRDSIQPQINYKVINDTLIITDLRYLIQSTGFQPVRIHAPKSLKSVILKDSELSIGSTGSGKISVKLDNSSVWFSQTKSKSAYYSNLEIMAKNNSRANTNEFMVDTLNIFLNNSMSNMQIKAKKITATLSDSSSIGLSMPDEIYLKKDSTSTFRVF